MPATHRPVHAWCLLLDLHASGVGLLTQVHWIGRDCRLERVSQH
jgi:hypothetical protein